MVLPFSEIIEAVKERLKYIAGKRAANDTFFYYQHTACAADMPVLLKFAEQTLAWLSIGLGSRCGGYAVQNDMLNIEIDSPPEGREAEVETLLTEAIVAGIILRWLRLTGFSPIEPWETQAADHLERLGASLRGRSRLGRRPLSPI